MLFEGSMAPWLFFEFVDVCLDVAVERVKRIRRHREKLCRVRESQRHTCPSPPQSWRDSCHHGKDTRSEYGLIWLGS